MLNFRKLNKWKGQNNKREETSLKNSNKELKMFKQLTNKLEKLKLKNTEKIKRTLINLFRLKHEISKLEPHLMASESLYDAQLKKKSI